VKRRDIVAASILGLISVGALGAYLVGSSWISWAGFVLNTFRSANSPTGSLVSERNRGESPARLATTTGDNGSFEQIAPGAWISYNRTLTSQRYSPLAEINSNNVHALKVLCTYDTHFRENFQSAPIVIDGALVFTTAFDTFSIDPSTCRELWHTHEDYKALTPLLVNRGAAYLDGRLFRGTLDGRVLAYNAKTGERLWATTIADPMKGELVDAAPVAWSGMVFVGNAIGDIKGVKGRMYALSESTGEILWETYLVPRAATDSIRGPAGVMPQAAVGTWENSTDVPISGGGTWTTYTLDPANGHLYIPVGNPAPDFVAHLRSGSNLFTDSVVELDAKTGAYISYFPLSTQDWHDWDASNAPALIMSRDGRHLLTVSPKNGYLYGFDASDGSLVFKSPVTRIENTEARFSVDRGTRFCPGVAGGGEWNGVAYDPRINLLFSGEEDWCTTIRIQTDAQVRAVPGGGSYTGNAHLNPMDLLGVQDPLKTWGGWLYATDADSGVWKWRAKTNYPILGGVTATAGGLVFFGDIGGNFYALDSRTGERLWGQKLAGAIAGGVITFTAQDTQKVAVAAGMTSIMVPTEQATAKIVILGLSIH
jgi:alcohol dehydrogenase (cytochrome c)